MKICLMTIVIQFCQTKERQKKNPMRVRALHKNPSHHGLGIQRFSMESLLLSVGSSYAAIQRRYTSMNFIPTLVMEMADLGSGPSLIFFLVSS